MTSLGIPTVPCIPELSRTFAREAASEAAWAAYRARRSVAPVLPDNIVENATRAAYEVLEPWFLEHPEAVWHLEFGTDLAESGDYTPAPPDALFEAAVNAAADQL